MPQSELKPPHFQARLLTSTLWVGYLNQSLRLVLCPVPGVRPGQPNQVFRIQKRCVGALQ